MPFLSLSLPFLLIARHVLAQDLGTYFSTCSINQPYPRVQIGDDYGLGLGATAYCQASSAPPTGFQICASGAYDAFLTDNQDEFKCMTSLDSTCNGGCPTGTTCYGSGTSGPGGTYYFCGVKCAGDTFLCDNAGALTLGNRYVAYCNADTDSCGTCASPSNLSPPSDPTLQGSICSNPITAFAAYSSMRRRRSDAQIQKRKREMESESCLGGGMLCKVAIAGGAVVEECIDHLQDVNSCGGCIGSGGKDCEQLEGVSLGGVSCSAGSCVITQCETDYTLLSGTCFRTLDIPAHLTHLNGTTATTKFTVQQRRNDRLDERAPAPAPVTQVVSQFQLRFKDQFKIRSWQDIFEVEGYSGDPIA